MNITVGVVAGCLGARVSGPVRSSSETVAAESLSVIEIRDEQPGDEGAIRDVNRRAFGGDQECRIIDALRANGVVLLSLVATLNGRVVGHILYSPVWIGDVTGAALGPMAVVPEHQRGGIGSMLVEEGTLRLRHAGCPFIVVLGHARYYPRFGFTSAVAHGITCEWDVPDDVFMVLIPDGARMAGVSGQARYRPEFSIAT